MDTAMVILQKLSGSTSFFRIKLQKINKIICFSKADYPDGSHTAKVAPPVGVFDN